MENTTDPELNGSSAKSEEEERDFFRDTNIRLLGYASEVGESFSNVISKSMYRASYGVAISYVVADAIQKGWTERHRRLKELLHDAHESTPPPLHAPAGVSDAQPAMSDAQAVNLDTGGALGGLVGHSLGEGQKAEVEAIEGDTWPPVAAAVDALMWHGVATVAIPGVTINRAVWFTTRLIDSLEKRRQEKVKSGQTKMVSPQATAAMRRWVPAAVGLALIPLIVHPTDYYMDRLMDIAVRPYLGTPKHTE